MSKQFIEGMDLLEVNSEKVGNHIAWMLRNAVAITTQPNDVNSLVFNDDCPQDVWGMFHAPSRSIVINLQQHLGTVMDQLQDVKYMNTSFKVILIHELIDTILHEAHHAAACLTENNWEDGNIKEDDATKYASESSWAFAEKFDVNVEDFGEEIDAFLIDLYKGLEEDVKEVNCKTWKRLQFHMMNNNVNYYNPDKGIEIISIREVFEAQVQPEEEWMPTDDKSFNNYKEVVVDAPIIETPAEVVQEPVAPVQAAPVTPTPVQTTQAVAHAATSVPEGYDPLDDLSTEMVTEDEEYVPPSPTSAAQALMPANTQTPAPAQAAPVEQTPVNPPMDVQRIQNIAEQVMRRMFHHVFTKCEFNTAGGFNNVNAILEPIPIADIDGATELFAKQDTLNEQGVFASHVPTNGMIKGLPTAAGLPRYTFYLNIGGNLHKRVFIAQNPMKKNASGMPTAWANKVMAGGKIMMLLADNQGITAHAELEAGQPLGQEKFVIWSKK